MKLTPPAGAKNLQSLVHSATLATNHIDKCGRELVAQLVLLDKARVAASTQTDRAVAQELFVQCERLVASFDRLLANLGASIAAQRALAQWEWTRIKAGRDEQEREATEVRPAN